MKKYQIIKTKQSKSAYMYAVATKEDIKNYYKTHFLPLALSFSNKKDLIYIIENNENYKHLKNNTSYKTIFIY